MLKDTGRLTAAPDSGFTPLQMFSKLLILQISVQQDTQPLSARENIGLSLPGLGQLLMYFDSVQPIQIPFTKPPVFPTTDSALVGFVGLE